MTSSDALPEGLKHHLKILEDQRKVLKDAQSRKGQRPSSGAPRSLRVMQFMMQLEHDVRAQAETGALLRQTFVPLAYPPCIRPLGELRKIFFSDLRLESHHRGTYIELTTITPSARINGIITLAEDDLGDVVSIQLLHQDPTQSAEQILPKGAKVQIKEPFLKATDRGESFGIRIDHLSDIIHLSEDENSEQERSHTAAKHLEQQGIDFLDQSKFPEALEKYDRALESSPSGEETRTLQLDRSLVLLKLGRLTAALSEVEYVLSHQGTPSEKALYRKSQVLYSLQRYRECSTVLTYLLRHFPDNLQAAGLMKKTIQRLKEQEKGQYRFKDMDEEAKEKRPPLLDRATYKGPVEVRSAGSRGRGLFTTRAVKAGELLLCEKAFGYAFTDTSDAETLHKVEATALVNVETDTVSIGGEADLISGIVRKIFREPSLAATIKDLHHGSYESVDVSEVDGKPVVDSFLVERVVNINCFASPLSSRDEAFELFPKKMTTTGKGRQNPAADEEAFESCGLWPTASYINHSCLSNANHSFIGDMMMVRASASLPADTEILIKYRDVDHLTGEETKKMMKNMNMNKKKKNKKGDKGKMEHGNKEENGDDGDGDGYGLVDAENNNNPFRDWGFECDCALCADMRSTPATTLARRCQLRDTVAEVMAKRQDKAGTIKIEKLISELEATYHHHDDYYDDYDDDDDAAAALPRVALSELQLGMAIRHFMVHGNPRKSIEWALMALRSMGYVIEGGELPGPMVIKKWGAMRHILVHCWMLLEMAYGRLGAVDLSAQAGHYEKLAYEVCVGEAETFEDSISRIGGGGGGGFIA